MPQEVNRQRTFITDFIDFLHPLRTLFIQEDEEEDEGEGEQDEEVAKDEEVNFIS